MSLLTSVSDIVAASSDPLLSKHESWQRVRLGDVARILNGFAFKSSRFGKRGMPLIRIRDVGHSETACRYDGEYGPDYIVEPGDFLVGMDGDFRAFRWAGPRALLNQRVCKISVDSNVYMPELLEHVLPGYLAAIHVHTSSQTVKHLSSRSIADIPLPLPPLQEQRRIVAKVEELLAQVNSATDHLAKVPAILKRFRQAVLSAAFSGRLTEEWRDRHHSIPPTILKLEERRSRSIGPWQRQSRTAATPVPDASSLPDIPTTWEWAWLPELGELNRGKSRHRPRNDPRLYGGPYPFVQTGDIARSGGRVVSHSQTYNKAGFEQSRLWPAGTVCITIAANIAESAILTYPACFPDSVVGLVADPELSIAEYVEYFVRTVRNDLAQYAPATAQANINLEILREVAVPLPPVEEQREIVGRVTMLLETADAVERRASASGVHAQRLIQSILAKAFRGELVPTEAELAAKEGRDYEPTSLLIERTRAQQKSPEGPRGRHRTRRIYPAVSR